MDKKSERIKKALPTALIVVFIAILIAAAFVFGGGAGVTTASESAVDPEAVRVFNAARAYLSSRDFETGMTGTVKARVFGIPYTQKVRGSRAVKDGVYTDTAESASAFVKTAVRKTVTGDEYSVAHGDYKRKQFVFGTSEPVCREDYVAAYGKPNTGLIKYEADGAIVKAVKESDDVYTFELDPTRAATYCRNEIKTALDTESYPDYSLIKFTLFTDGERPVKITACEKFRVDKMGGIDCTVEYTETFEY